MKNSEKFRKVIILIGLSILSIGKSQDIEDSLININCDDEYDCSSEAEPANWFVVGKKYTFSYDLSSLMKVEKVLSSKLEKALENGGRNAMTQNGSLKLTPISSCEVVASLDETNVEEFPALKVAFSRGGIARVCFSKGNFSGPHVNTLKSMISMLQLNSQSNNLVLFDGYEMEASIRGTCLTKYFHCPENNDMLIKYQSTNYCETPTTGENTMAQNTKLKVEDFQKKISQSQYSNDLGNLCKLSLNSSQASSVPTGLIVCSVEKVNGILTASQCLESIDVEKFMSFPVVKGKLYNKASLKLTQEVAIETSENWSNVNFVKTSLQQTSTLKRNKQKRGIITSEDSHNQLREILKTLTNSTKLESLDLRETKNQIILVKTLLKSSDYQDVLRYFNKLIISSAAESNLRIVKKFLNILANEANNESVMKIIQNSFTNNDVLINKLSKDDRNSIFQSIAQTSLVAQPSMQTIRFSQFLLEYVHNNSRYFTDLTKLKTLTAYSKNLNAFCNMMQIISGEKYCLSESLIQNSPIIRYIQNANETTDKIAYLEAMRNFQHHDFNATLALKMNDQRNMESLNLWGALNSHKASPCGKGKYFQRNILQDTSSPINLRIAAFLALARCFDKSDAEAVNSLFEDPQQNEEILEFIQGYKANRILYEIDDLAITSPEKDNALSNSNEKKSSKQTRASNTFTIFPLPYLGKQVKLETNMLYFDEPAMIPELITLSFSVMDKNSNEYSLNAKDILEVEVYINTESSETQSGFDFKANVIVRRLGETVFIKRFPVNQESLLQLLQNLQQIIQTVSAPNHTSTYAKEKIRQLVILANQIDIFNMKSLLNEKILIPTLYGIPYKLSWNVDSFSRVLINKNDCTDLFLTNDNETSSMCRLVVKPELFVDGQLSLHLDSNNDEGLTLHGNLSAEYPLTLEMLRREGTKEESIKLALPSLEHSLIKFQGELKDMSGNTQSKHWEYGLGMKGLSTSIDHTTLEKRTLDVVLSKYTTEKRIVAKISDETYHARLESITGDGVNIKGNLTFSEKSGIEKNYMIQVEFKNDPDSKKILGKFIKDENEYSLNAYYVRELKNREENRHKGFLSCGYREGTGILCWWPFCVFCGTEFSLGATVNTPQFKNVKLFETTVTQIFPNKKINLTFKSDGIPILKKTKFTVSLTYTNSTMDLQNVRIKEAMDEKLRHHFSPSHLTGDALPESESTGHSYYTSVYSLDAQLQNTLFGESGASIVYLAVRPAKSFSDSYMVGGEFFYPMKRQQERLSLLSSFIQPDLHNTASANTETDYVSETSIRSSHYSTLNTDLNIRYRKLESAADKVVVVLRPVNLIRGEIKLEIIDYVGKGLSYNYDEFLQSSLDNLHFNQSYKVFLPDTSRVKIMKGKVALKRVDSILHTAGVEILVGVDESLELQYNYFPETKVVDMLTSVTAAGETYGLYHHFEPVKQQIHNDGTDVDTNGHKYTGTYVLAEQSLKAKGTFQARKGKEMLPFSNFDILVNSLEEKEDEISVFGSEIVEMENSHNIKMGITIGNSSIMDLISEINSFERNPIKGKIFLKDIGQIEILSSSKLDTKQNLQVKAKYFPKMQTLEGNIGFPTSFNSTPLYLDFYAAISNENDMENSLVILNSSSAVDFQQKFRIATKNTIQLSDLKWEFGLEGEYINDFYSGYVNESWLRKQLNRFSLSTEYSLPDLEKYSFEILKEDNLKNSNYYHKYNLLMHRPHVTPMHLRFEIGDQDEYDFTFRRSSSNHTFHLTARHKDNFLYIFPMLDLDCFVSGLHNIRIEQRSILSNLSRHQKTNITGMLQCQSQGIPLPLCDLFDLTYEVESDFHETRVKPWIVNWAVINDLANFTDKLQGKMVTTFEQVKSVSPYFNDEDDDNILIFFITTVDNGYTYKHTYSIEYDLQRQYKEGVSGNEIRPPGVRGTYIYTQMYESLEFFEFTDHHTWDSLNDKGFHIWTNVINHTTDYNQTTELVSFSSQYASLDELDRNPRKGPNKNITWMELRSTLSITGFGTLKSFVLEPSVILNSLEGDLEADFLVRTEFSPIKTFRMTFAHEHSKSENDEDDLAKFDALTKLNSNLNNVELSGINSLTLALGKFLALGNSFTARFGPEDDAYEYISLKTFVVSPFDDPDHSKEKLIHVDVMSSWTNADDDDTDLKLASDIIYSHPFSEFPLVRLAYVENSTDIEKERNGSIFIYQSTANQNTPNWKSGVPLNIVSENLNEVSFTEYSLQSLSQQIVDDYYDGGTDSGLLTKLDVNDNDQVWHDYNFEIQSRTIMQVNSSNVLFTAKLMGFEEKIFYCRSVADTCLGNEVNTTEYRIDTSNYCNLLILPVKPLMYQYLS